MSALKIIKLRSDNILELNLEEFKSIITKHDVVDRSLVVISIAGAMRKGKSFLLNFFLTYAYKQYGTTRTIAHPSKLANETLIDGFSHCGGTERHTTGIQVWPDLFLYDYPNGKKIAILFMDTQGTFDYDTKLSDCVSIFALSTLLSSVQIYNISSNIQNDHLQYLALFVEYARLALDQSSTIDDVPSFDKLLILVRDWGYPYEADFGLAGGKNKLDKIFASGNVEVHKTVTSIQNKFEKLECFLMPFPGNTIASAEKFDGAIDKIDKNFLMHAAILIEHLLTPEKLQIKKINGIELKVGDFVNLIEQGFKTLSKYENISKPKTISDVTAESHNFKIIADAVDLYKTSMYNELANKKYLDNAIFMQLQLKYFNESMKFYENADKIETYDEEIDLKWKTQLEKLLIRESNFFLIRNEKQQPNTSEELQTLIKVITDQKEMIKNLSEQHAQNMLDLINTFRRHEETNRNHITELTRSFEQSPSAGFDLMGIIMKIIDVVPTTISAIGKTVSVYTKRRRN